MAVVYKNMFNIFYVKSGHTEARGEVQRMRTHDQIRTGERKGLQKARRGLREERKKPETRLQKMPSNISEILGMKKKTTYHL